MAKVNPVIVLVPQAEAVCHTALTPKLPLACTKVPLTESCIANSVIDGLLFAFIAISKVAAVGLLTVGAVGTLAKV